jgi:prepilin-type N-terminal cleavage/methylation domain-containing protein
MRAQRAIRRNAFTLVEILIVVIILGILATIIIGLFGNSSRDANVGALKDNLRAIRGAIQVYNAQHNGHYPALASFNTQMTQYSNAAGATSAVPATGFNYGPYLLSLPPLSVGTDKGATTVTSTTYSSGFGWGYDATNGKFQANCPDTDKDDSGVAYNTY